MAAAQRLRRAIMGENAAGRPKIFSVFSMGDRYFQGRRKDCVIMVVSTAAMLSLQQGSNCGACGCAH